MRKKVDAVSCYTVSFFLGNGFPLKSVLLPGNPPVSGNRCKQTEAHAEKERELTVGNIPDPSLCAEHGCDARKDTRRNTCPGLFEQMQMYIFFSFLHPPIHCFSAHRHCHASCSTTTSRKFATLYGYYAAFILRNGCFTVNDIPCRNNFKIMLG